MHWLFTKTILGEIALIDMIRSHLDRTLLFVKFLIVKSHLAAH